MTLEISEDTDNKTMTEMINSLNIDIVRLTPPWIPNDEYVYGVDKANSKASQKYVAMKVVCAVCLGTGRVPCKHLLGDDSCNVLHNAMVQCPTDRDDDCTVTCQICKGIGHSMQAVDSSNWSKEAAAHNVQSVKKSKKRRVRKRYEVKNEEVKVERGKRQRIKYTNKIVIGDLV
jgi:hypothetical protein